LQKLFKPRRREKQQIVIFDGAGIAQSMWDVARSHERIPRPQDEHLVSNRDLELSGKDKIRFVLTRMRMPRYRDSRREGHLEQAICPAGLPARQTYRTDAHVEVESTSFRLKFDQRRLPKRGRNIEHQSTPVSWVAHERGPAAVPPLGRAWRKVAGPKM